MFHRMFGRMLNPGIDDEKYIFMTVLRENIQKGILQQMTNIYSFHNIFFLFFKGAAKSYRKIFFVSATKIGENTTNILNCYFSS